MNSEVSELREIAGLLAALPNLTPEARLMATDAVLTRLDSVSPALAQIVGTLLAEQPHQLSGKDDVSDASLRVPGIVNSFQPYDGRPLLDSGRKESLVDCLILTVKSVELEAVLAAYRIEPKAPDERVAGGRSVRFFSRDNLRFAISPIGTDGNTESAIAFGRLYESLRPRSAVLIGMAGGVKGEVGLGDVVVATQVYAYDFRRLTAEGDLPRFKTSSVSPPLIREAEFLNINDRGWAARVGEEVREVMKSKVYDTKSGTLPPQKWMPKATRGGILAGGSLIEDGSLPAFAKSLHDQVKAAEMEGAGFATAASEVGVPWLVIRGIADHGEPGRRKKWQFGSTFTAAAYFRDALASGSIGLGLEQES